jgi:1-acyl-sn-glycerol-3-phosphate acyltransferase
MMFRNLLFYLGLTSATILFASLGCFVFLFPFKIRYYLITRWSHFFIFWAKVCCGLKYSVAGSENLPTQNAIVLSNHQSMWETIFMQILLPEQSWVLKKELFYIPVFGWGLALLEPIAINRKASDSIKVLIRQGKERLEKNRWVVIFPEGTRVAPTAIRRYSRSGAALAEATGFPIVPIAHNAGHFWPKGFFIKKPGTIKVVIGPNIDPKGKTITEINELVEQWIRKKVFELNTLTKTC